MSDKLQVRTTSQLMRLLKTASGLHKIVNEEYGKKSTYARLALTDESRLWAHSPYVAQKARHLLYVTATGAFIYVRRELLRLNQLLDWIPAAIEMKHAKLREFLAQCPNGTNAADYIRDRWKSTHFALVDSDHEYISTATDSSGITLKSVKLPCNQPRGHDVWREICVILDDYVQWFDPSRSEDRWDAVEIDVDIPTLDLDVFVVVDCKLYDHSRNRQRPSLDNPRALHFSYRTTEGQELLSELTEIETLHKLGSFIPRDENDIDDEYRSTVVALQSMWTQAARTFLGANELSSMPEKLYFYRVQLERVTPGLRVNIDWLKPERPHPSTS